MNNFEILSNPGEIYEKMLKDIASAKKQILFENYIYENNEIGRLFRKELVKKAKQGVKVKVLLDSLGSKNIRNSFFHELKQAGGWVRFFRNVSSLWRIITSSYEVNHRKLLIIDDNISHIGSLNISSKFLNWRELNLRLQGEIAKDFSTSFNMSWNLSTKFGKKKLKTIIHKGFEIIHDIPKRNRTKSRYIKLIKGAKHEILIETPYFIPPILIRRALKRAVKRGVNVKILLPFISDVKIIDIIRNRYLGSLHNEGVKIFYYEPKILHSKLLLVDNDFFLLGSSNLDYRSFTHDHQLNLLGQDKKIISSLKEFYESGLKNSIPFNYSDWKKRSSFTRLLEMLFSNIQKHL
ncbi:MAG: phosphatidylserine/phosphatidylglycerophosphate/cardiolipin synthase family protein [Nanoarchaeota archaeon]